MDDEVYQGSQALLDLPVEAPIPVDPPQGLQAELDLLYLWNPDVANQLVKTLREMIEELTSKGTRIFPYEELEYPVVKYQPTTYNGDIYIANENYEEKPENFDPTQWILISKTSLPKFLSVERLGSYIYKVTFDSIPEYKEVSEFIAGACSSYVKDGKLYRNFDWKYDNTASFEVVCKDFSGMASITGLNDGILNIEKIEQLPYHLVDGVNKDGIKISTHVLYNDWEYTGAGSKDQDIMLLPYYVLSNLHSISDINTVLGNYLANIKIPETLANAEYLLQFLVTDGTTTYAILPPESTDGSYVIQDITSNPKLTNFRWVNKETVVRTELQKRPTGVERWNEIVTSDLEDLRFTKCYETPTRLSEFIGIDNTTKDSTDAELEDIYNRAHAIYVDGYRGDGLWQTVHSVVFGNSSIDRLWTQEDWNIDYICASKTDLELETKARINGDETLDGRINAEQGLRYTADTELGTRIDNEITRSTGAESALSDRITANADAISAETTAREQADEIMDGQIGSLSTIIDTEIQNRTDADAALDNRITQNATDISEINAELDTYGNIVTHDVDEFATSSQGAKADTAIQPNDNISELTNDSGYQTQAQVNSAISTHDTSSTAHNDIRTTLDEKADEADLQAHIDDKTNPHEVTKAQVGLGNVDNTSDLNKPISAATQAALDGKQATISDLATIRSGATKGATSLQPADIINNVTSTATDKSLSANMGKELQDQITNLKARGRYLSIWNCTTGLAETTPTVDPYEYKSGDYFIVGIIGTTNYRPSGSTYSESTPSTVVETGDVKVNDTYYYDGTTWTLLDIGQVASTFASLGGSPYDNSNLASALNDKADEADLQAHIDDKTNPHEVTKAQVGLGNVDNTNDLSKPISTATQAALNEKQDVISDLDDIRSGAEAGSTAVQPDDLATVATTGSYDDLIDKPTIPAAQVNSDWNATSGVAEILNKPTIPTKTSDLTNDSGFITSSYHDSTKQDKLIAGENITITGVPAGYTQLEYIESTGTQYIDTEYIVDENCTLEYKLLPLQTSSNQFYLGVRTANASQQGSIEVFRWSSTTVTIRYNNQTISLEDYNQIFTVKADTNLITVNGINYPRTTQPLDSFPNYSLYLFAMHLGQEQKPTSEKTVVRFYYFNIKKNNILVRNFVPAKRNSDSAIGMYDLVSNTFFTNAGTGSFIAGPNITISGNIISATDTKYTQGNGITITGTTISANVVNNTTSTSTTNALSANMGKVLQDQINNHQTIGKFLSFWDCTTGLPLTNPQTSPYTYHTGDYYRIKTVASAGGTNYRPSGSSYTIGVASTTVETEIVTEGQVYYYDGTSWGLAGGGAVTVDNSTVSYNDNSELQAIGVIDDNDSSTAIKTWTGTLAEYEAITTKDADTLYNVTDDVSGGSSVYTKTEVDTLLSGKANVGVSYTKAESDGLLASTLQTLYPVGSVYIGTQASCPLASLIPGSSWSLVAQDRSLQGSSGSHTAGSTIAAGLPNIEGAAYDLAVVSGTSTRSGALNFNGDYDISYTGGGSASYWLRGRGITFKASDYNGNIYGKSSTVQPPAYIVNIWRRTA